MFPFTGDFFADELHRARAAELRERAAGHRRARSLREALRRARDGGPDAAGSRDDRFDRFDDDPWTTAA